MNKQMPTHDQTVVFQTVAPGSYCRPGEAYRVERPRNKGDFRFVSVERGSSTYDRPAMVAMAAWTAVS